MPPFARKVTGTGRCIYPTACGNFGGPCGFGRPAYGRHWLAFLPARVVPYRNPLGQIADVAASANEPPLSGVTHAVVNDRY